MRAGSRWPLRRRSAVLLLGALGLAWAGPVRGQDPPVAVPAPVPVPAVAEAETAPAQASPVPPEEGAWSALEILGERVEPGGRHRLSLEVSRSFAGARVRTPVLVLRGSAPGPTLCLTAGIHGDEVNGVEVVRGVVERLRPAQLRGTVIAVPIVNLPAFRRGSRYLPDRRDLNRYFPGSPQGSAASRIADALFRQVVSRCDVLVDIHTGSFHRTNQHQLRADLRDEAVVSLARGFGAPVVVHNEGRPGTLRRAAVDAGIPAITLEAGEPARFSRRQVELGISGTLDLLAHRGMFGTPRPGGLPEQRTYRRARWVRVDDGGILVGAVSLGERVEPGQALGLVSDPLSNRISEIRSPYRGEVIGLAFDQLVMPGFAAFHIAVEDADLLDETPELWAQEPDLVDEERAGMDLDERPE